MSILGAHVSSNWTRARETQRVSETPKNMKSEFMECIILPGIPKKREVGRQAFPKDLPVTKCGLHQRRL